MKKINKKYLAAAIVSGGITALPIVKSASAAQLTASDNIDVNLTASASSISFEIANAANGILMTIPAGSNEASSVSNLTITNKSTAVPIYVSGIIVDSSKPVTSYTNENYGTYDFASSPIDSKHWGLAVKKAGATSLSPAVDLKTGYSGNSTRDIIPAGGSESITYELAGKSSAYSTDVAKAKIGELTVTVTTKQD